MSTATVATPDLTNEEYHALPSWSSSQTKLLPDEPELFFRRHVEKAPAFQFNQTASMKLGTAVHRAILDGTPVKLIPDDVLSASGAKAGKAWKQFEAEFHDLVLCKPDDPILHMVESIRAEPMAAKWLAAEGSIEQSIAYEDPVTGLPLRARPDKAATVEDDRVVILDPKTTTKDPYSGREMAKVMAEFGYHKQAAWYWDAVELLGKSVEAFLFIFVQNKAPYVCHVVEMTPEDIERGRRQNRRALDDLARRLESDNWKPETYGTVTYVELPEWYRKQEDENYDQ